MPRACVALVPARAAPNLATVDAAAGKDVAAVLNDDEPARASAMATAGWSHPIAGVELLAEALPAGVALPFNIRTLPLDADGLCVLSSTRVIMSKPRMKAGGNHLRQADAQDCNRTWASGSVALQYSMRHPQTPTASNARQHSFVCMQADNLTLPIVPAARITKGTAM